MDDSKNEAQYAPKQYSLKQNLVALPYCIQRKLRIRKNLVNFVDEEYQQSYPMLNNYKSQSIKQPLSVPFQMSQTFIKYMLLYRITAYLSLISMFVSLFNVYSTNSNDNLLIYINNGITAALIMSLVGKFVQLVHHQKSKKALQQEYWGIYNIVDLMISLPHPTIWTPQQNSYLHLALMFRLIFPIKYFIYSSTYCDVRAYRVITTYGLNSNQHFFFALKALAAGLDLFQVLLIQFASLLYLAHGLYLVSLAGELSMHYMDCFEVIIVTIPTVGFGEYDMPFLGQKVVICFTLTVGLGLNSFIIWTLLNQLQMTEQQLSSYKLMQKVKTRQTIQKISKIYIQKAISHLARNKIQEKQSDIKQLIHYDFRSQYRLKKSLYHSISYTDINNLFTYFRESLIQFRIKQKQVDNMLNVAITALLHNKFIKNDKKQQKIGQQLVRKKNKNVNIMKRSCQVQQQYIKNSQECKAIQKDPIRQKNIHIREITLKKQKLIVKGYEI